MISSFLIEQSWKSSINKLHKASEKLLSYANLIGTGATQMTLWQSAVPPVSKKLLEVLRPSDACRLAIIGSDNGLSPGRHQAIIWINAGIMETGPVGTNFSEILIVICTFSIREMHLKMSSGKWRPFCLGLNVLVTTLPFQCYGIHCTIKYGRVSPGIPSISPLGYYRLEFVRQTN